MKQLYKILLAATVTLAASSEARPEKRVGDFWLGADISGTTSMEADGIRFFNNKGEERENTALMKELGMNAVRIRVWVNPKDGFSGQEDVLEMARRAKKHGMEIMLCFHYSDSWADPGKQPVPEAWKGYDYKKMKKAVADHTAKTISNLKKNGIEVKWMQLGNETTNGMLWDMGRAETNMEQYAGLSQAAYEAVKKVSPETECIVHLDGGADIDRYHNILNGLKKYGADFDMIGMSVYPYWDLSAGISKSEDETLAKVLGNIKTLADEYSVPVMITETGYQAARPNEGYAFMRKLIDGANNLEECEGVFYWAPELQKYYPLGAFKDNRPTRILDAFKEASENVEAQDTTFFSTFAFDCKSENGVIRGSFYQPHSSPYAKDGKYPVVLIAHGFNSDYRGMINFAECFARNGIAAYLFDFCGGGMTSTSDGKTTDMSVMTEKADLEAITKDVKKLPQVNPSEIFLLGGSQGGLVSTVAAAANKSVYKGAVLLYPALGIPDTAEAMLKRTEQTPEFEFWNMKMSRKYYQDILGLDAFSELEKVDCPVEVIYGDNDPITPPAMIERLQAMNKKIRIDKIDGGQHGFPHPFHLRLAETYALDFVENLLR